jgi:peptide/nickel transport system ATP-binding protein/oligopeptide transport system ATP-binding protein
MTVEPKNRPAAGQPTPIFRIEGLRVEYPRGRAKIRAVRDVDVEIYEGETLALVGESGCGKSTLGRALLRLQPAAAGKIWFYGVDIAGATGAELRRLRADLQMVFQDPFSSLNPRRKVGDIVAEPLRHARGMSRSEARLKALEVLGKVGLDVEAAGRHPGKFSGGQRQRIGIARALAPGPKFVVADEPVSALDVSVQAQVVNLLSSLAQEQNLTVVFISHDLGVVRHVADRVALMYLGQIVEIADRDSFFAGPAHPYGEALLSAVPAVERERARERIVLEGELPDPAAPPAGCLFSTRCPSVTEQCRTSRPQLRELAPGRQVRCHFPKGFGG